VRVVDVDVQYPDVTQVQTANILGNSSIDDCSKKCLLW